MNETNYVKLEFAYTDEYGQESRLNKTLTTAVIEDITTFEMLVEEFKSFLSATGFARSTVDTITIVVD